MEWCRRGEDASRREDGWDVGDEGSSFGELGDMDRGEVARRRTCEVVLMKGIVWVSSTVWVGEKQLDERGVGDEGSSSGELGGMGKGGGGGGAELDSRTGGTIKW